MPSSSHARPGSHQTQSGIDTRAEPPEATHALSWRNWLLLQKHNTPAEPNCPQLLQRRGQAARQCACNTGTGAHPATKPHLLLTGCCSQQGNTHDRDPWVYLRPGPALQDRVFDPNLRTSHTPRQHHLLALCCTRRSLRTSAMHCTSLQQSPATATPPPHRCRRCAKLRAPANIRPRTGFSAFSPLVSGSAANKRRADSTTATRQLHRQLFSAPAQQPPTCLHDSLGRPDTDARRCMLASQSPCDAVHRPPKSRSRQSTNTASQDTTATM